MGDIEAVGRIVLTQPAVQVTFVVGVLVLAPVAMACARRLHWSRARVVWAGLAGACLALVPATTLARGDLFVDWTRPCGLAWSLSVSGSEAALNTLLFAPAGFFAVLAVRRASPVVVAVVGGSLMVEAVQLVTGLGTCETADVARNVVGALVACGTAALLLRIRPRASRSVRPPP